MAVPGLDASTVLKIRKIVDAVLDERTKKPPMLPNLARTPIVPAQNGELFARFEGNILIADLVALDSAAGVYASGKLTYETSRLPKIKIGRALTESQIEQLASLMSAGWQNETRMYDFFMPIINNCLEGIDCRLEALLVAMKLDRLDYDKLGYKAEGLTWGMPSDLKVTTAVPWTDYTNADPVDDLLALVELGQVRYGIQYDRVVMSRQAFKHAIACVKFQNKAKLYLPPSFSFDNLSGLDFVRQRQLFEGATGLSIELNDYRYWYQNESGQTLSARYHPINEVFLESSSTDNNASAIDIGNGDVMETALIGMANGYASAGSSAINMPTKGPIGYFTLANPQLNPPGVTMWASQVAFPRKHLLQANARLTVGQFNDMIPVTPIT